MKSVTPRISPEVETWLVSTFGTKGAGAEYLLESQYQLYRRYTASFKKLFSENEISLMLDVINGCMLSPQIAGQHIQANVADGCLLDEMAAKWSVESTQLLQKIKGLHLAERAMLEIWLQNFWYQKETRDLNEWIKK